MADASERSEAAEHGAPTVVRRVVGPIALVATVVIALAVAGPGGRTGTGLIRVPNTPTPIASPADPVTPADSSASGSTGAGSPTSAAPTASSPTVTVTSATPGGPTGGPVQSTGQPGVDSPGVSMTVIPQKNDTFLVQETIWMSRATASMQLAPPDLANAGRPFASSRLQLTGVTISADGRPVPMQDTTVTTSRTVALAAPASAFSIRYTISGAIVRSQPSVAGRALGAIRPLLPADEPQLPVLILVSGAAPLSLVCPDLGSAATDCAGPTDQGWRLSRPLTAAQALVLVQLDLNDA